MTRKISFVLFTLLLYIQCTWACSAAYQYSLFPLGSSMGQLVLLELDFERYLQTPEGQVMQFGPPGRFSQEEVDATGIEVRWKGNIKLYTYQGDKMILHKDLGHIDILDKKYEDALLPYFLEAMQIARKLDFFEEARLESMGICHYDRSCTFFEKIINEEELKFYCKSMEAGYEKDSCEVAYPPKILQKAETKMQVKFTQIDSLEQQLQIDFFRVWSPQNIRRYTIGNTTVQVYTLGKGVKSKYYKTKRKDWEKINIQGVEYFIQGNDVIYHGQRFDFIQIL